MGEEPKRPVPADQPEDHADLHSEMMSVDIEFSNPPPAEKAEPDAAAAADDIPEGTHSDDLPQIEESALEPILATPAEATPRVQLDPQAGREPYPLPGAPGRQPAPFDPQQTPLWQELVNEYEREAAAVGNVPAAAPLAYEVGRIWEEKLAQLRNAWSSYNRAFQLDPRLLANIRSASRLASKVGNWNVVLQILDSESQAIEDPHHRAYLHYRQGLILEEKLGKVDEARAAYLKAGELDPENLELLKVRERLAAAAGSWEELLEVRRRMLGLVQDARLKVQLLLGCAQVERLRLDNESEAEKHYREALELQPENLQALGALREIYSRAGRTEPLVDILQREAAITGEPGAAAGLLYEAARLLREKLSEEEKAVELLARALALVPQNQMVLAEMAAIYENLMRWNELVDTCERLAAVMAEPGEKVAMYFKLGTILEEKLFADERAIESYRQVVELNPRFLPALQALGKLFFRKGQWQQLVDMYELEIRETQDKRQKATRLYKLAEILEERLGQDEEAIGKLELSLEMNPGYLPVLKSLGRLYTKYNRFESLIRMYEGELETTSDRDQAVFLLDKIGTLWEEKLGNVDKAIETYQRLLEVAPNYLPAIRTLGKLYVQSEKWPELLQVNEAEAQLINDQKQVVSLLHRNGEICEEKLGDKDRAIETYQKVLALAPSYLPALQNLGRLYFLKGRWDDLIDMYRQEIEVTLDEEQQINLLYKIGQLYEEKLIQEDKAVNVYREILRIQPGNTASLKALERLYTNRRDWSNLIEILRLEAEHVEDVKHKALSLFKVAEILERHLGDTDGAVQTLRQLQTLLPGHAPGGQMLVRRLGAQQDWRGLLSAYERQLAAAAAPQQQVRALECMAELLAHRLNDLLRASECYEKILAIEPGNLAALEALERIALSQRNYPTLVRVYEQVSGLTADPRYQSALQSQLADLKENRLQPPQNPGQHLLKMLQVDANHPEAQRLLELLYHKYGTWQGLRNIYEQQLRSIRSDEEAVELCVRLADLAEARLEKPELAVHYLQEALRLKPDYLPALKAMRRIRLQQGEAREAVRLLEREARACRDRQQSLAALLLEARLLEEQLQDAPAAAECLFRVLEQDPRHGQAFARLEELLEHQQDFERMSVLLRNRLDATEDPGEKVTLLVKLGDLYRERLARPQEALRVFQQVLALQPASVQAVSALAELSFHSEQWQEAVYFGRQLEELTQDPALLADNNLRLGIIYQEKQPDMQKAVQYLSRASQMRPDDLGVLERLKAIYVATQRWEEAVGALDRIIVGQPDPARKLQAQLEMAEIFEKGLSDPARAVDAYREAQQQHPNHLGVIQKLGELYQRLEKWEELVEAYHAFIRLLPPERQQDAVPLHMRLGGIQHEKLGSLDRAIIEYKRACELNPRHLEAHEQLARLYGSSGLYYANAVDEHRKLLEINPFRLDSYHQMRRIFEEQRAYDKALCVCAVLHYLRAASPDEEFFYGENKGRVADRSAERLGEEALESTLVHTAEKGLLRSLLKLAGPHLARMLPAQLERYGVGKADRARPDDPVRTLVENIAANLGEVNVEVYLSTQPTHLVAIEPGDPTALIAGEALVKRCAVKEQRFALGQALKSVFDGSFLAIRLGEKELSRMVAALIHPYFPQCPLATFPSDLPVDLIKRVQKALPRKARRELEQLLGKAEGELARVPDYPAYLFGARSSAKRFGLLMCNDVPQAVQHCLREIPQLRDQRFSTTEEITAALAPYPELCELLRFAVSEDYFRLRARMKFSITG